KTFGAEVGGGNLAISRKIPKERQDAAWKFIEWMTSSGNAAQWSLASGYVATRKSAYEVPAMKEFLAKDSRYLVARDQLQYAAGKVMAPNFQKIREILKKQLDDAVDGKVSPKEAMATVQKQVEAVIKR
ncbi:MAG: extracellular solute-binding protein, partial [candidate division NC10 bacterium]|nr:extracellular solute-binding protein [candidate division NC10 bacterium]